MNQTLMHLTIISDIRHHLSIPYSKQENSIVERANKEVNRHIRNILVDKECIHEWPQMLRMTETFLNSSFKQPLGVSPNTILLYPRRNWQHTIIDSPTNYPGLCSYIDDTSKARHLSSHIVLTEGELWKLTEAIRSLSLRANSNAPTLYPGCTPSTGQYHAGINDHATDNCNQMDHWPRYCHLYRATPLNHGEEADALQYRP